MINLETYKDIFINETLRDFQQKHGITPDDSGCIGYSDKEKKWYGWSHRAIHGFGIGDEINKRTCGYGDMCKICPNCKIENDEQCKAIAKVFADAIS